MAKTKLLNRKDLIAYFLVAGTGAVVQIIAGSLFRNHLGYDESVALGYLVSFVVGFTLTKLFAFDARKTNQTRREMVKFGIVAFISFGVTVGTAHLMLKGLDSLVSPQYHLRFDQVFLPQKLRGFNINVNEFSALLFGMGCSFVMNYYLHKTFTFKSTGFYDRIKAYIR